MAFNLFHDAFYIDKYIGWEKLLSEDNPLTNCHKSLELQDLFTLYEKILPKEVVNFIASLIFSSESRYCEKLAKTLDNSIYNYMDYWIQHEMLRNDAEIYDSPNTALMNMCISKQKQTLGVCNVNKRITQNGATIVIPISRVGDLFLGVYIENIEFIEKCELIYDRKSLPYKFTKGVNAKCIFKLDNTTKEIDSYKEHVFYYNDIFPIIPVMNLPFTLFSLQLLVKQGCNALDLGKIKFLYSMISFEERSRLASNGFNFTNKYHKFISPYGCLSVE